MGAGAVPMSQIYEQLLGQPASYYISILVPALALGNVFGSNVFNLLGILGATALVAPVPVPDDILRIDLWAMAAATGLMLWVAASGARITRGEGGVLLGLWLVWTAGRAALG